MKTTISKSKLKAHMLEVFRQIEASGEEVIVTDRDRPVLRIIPIRPRSNVSQLFADVQGRVQYLEDINTPTTAEWEEV